LLPKGIIGGAAMAALLYPLLVLAFKIVRPSEIQDLLHRRAS